MFLETAPGTFHLLCIHSPAWVTLTATPERDMAAGHVPAVEAQRGQQPALGQGHHESSQR